MISATSEKSITNDIITLLLEKVADDSTRLAALEAFQKIGLPVKHEEYKYTPIARTLEKRFTFTVPHPGTQTRIRSFGIPGVDAVTLVFINGVFSPENSSAVPASVTIQPLEKALAESNPEAIRHFGKYARFEDEAFTAWNTAGWSDGVFIRVEDGCITEKPIVLHYLHDSAGKEVISVNRNLIVVGKNSEITLIEKFDSCGDPYFLNLVSEIAVDENAGLNFYSIQNDCGNAYQHSLHQIDQKASSRVNTYTFTLNGKLIRNNLRLTLDGEGIESHMYGLYLTNGDTLADNHTVVDHKKPNAVSKELYKGILDGNSKGVFNGKIFVRPHAQKTNAFQANRNILLTDQATVNTKPQLEIWADDVKCSHGCTTGQLDKEAVFYLRSRGIDEKTAQAMIQYAFAGEVIESIKHAGMKDYVDTLVRERLNKTF